MDIQNNINRLFISLLIVCFSIVLSVNKLFSQNNSTTDWEEIIEQISSDEVEEEKSVENYIEELSELNNQPFNINAVTKEQLEQFPFLSDIQIENILFYLYISGPMQTIYELQMIEGMDRQTIQYLLPFVYLGEYKENISTPSFKKMLKYGKHELITRLDIPLNKKSGYKSISDSVLQENPNKHYLGSPLYHSLRYGFHYKEQLYFGFTAEKDAGEPFFRKQNKKGYDYYSFYFLLKNMNHLKALVLGNYRLSFGLGLVMNTDYSMGKSSSIETISYKNNGIRKHSSTDEYNYFRGIAASYQLKCFVLTAFYSHRKLDATMENKLITSLKKDGIHRLIRDFERKENTVMQILGGNITYKNNTFHLGLTGVYNFFNRLFIPDIKPYNIFYPRGKCFYTLGIDYKYRWNKLSFAGEAAICQSGRVAILNILRFTPFSGYQLVMLQRYYDKRYAAWFARSISEGSDIRNENGFYIGIEANPIKYWKLSAYADFFHFPWLRYGVDKPSSGFDGLVQATYTPKRNMTMFLRYQYKVKDQNYIGEKKITCSYVKHKLRYQLGYTLQKFFSLRTTVDFVIVHPENVSSNHGFMLSQMFSYSFQQLPLQLSVNYGFFDTDNYESRLTTYEKGMLYSLSLPSFYGKGIRTSLHVQYDFNKYLTALVKISQSKYMDRDEIGTGLEMIAGNKKSDINMQIRYKF